MADRSELGPILDPEPVYPDPRNPDEAIERRHFLAVVGASAAFAGLAGCSPRPAPHGEIIPYVRPPEQFTPGVPLHFATAMALGGAAIGLVVTSHEGRPTKIEGNPNHPGSLGSSDVFSQASVLDMYEPDRSKEVNHRTVAATWDEAISALRTALEAQRPHGGARVRILSGATASPSFEAAMHDFLGTFKEARWVQFEPCGREAVAEGAHRAYGEAVLPVYDLSKADVILSLDAEFLSCSPGTVRYQRDFADRRRVRKDGKGGVKAEQMSRLYAVETMLGTTGGNAEHRLALKPSQVESFARALAAELKMAGVPAAGPLPDQARAWLGPLVQDLQAHRGRCVVMVGDNQPASLHTLGHALNEALGNVGRTVRFIEQPYVNAERGEKGLRQLVGEMLAGQVEILLILSCNPAYTAPVDIPFAEALKQVKLSVHLGLHDDETASLCAWHLPETHYLESWGDGRGFDGAVAIQQPLINPLYGGRSAPELITTLQNGVEKRGRDIVRDYWRKVRGSPANFDVLWDESVQNGVIPDTAAKVKSVKLSPDWAKGSAPIASEESVELAFQPDPVMYDGRFANNGWLQELPKPVTHLTWGNAAFISPRMARKLGIDVAMYAHGGQHGGVDTQLLELQYRGRVVRVPAFVVEGHADESVTLYLGHGRTRAGQVGTGVGFNAYALRTADAPYFGGGLEVKNLNNRTTLACTQAHHSMAAREEILHTSAGEFAKDPHFIPGAFDKDLDKAASSAPSKSKTPPQASERDQRLIPLSMYPPWPYPGNKWGMAIDLSTCTGCSACVVACQSENNIPVVGKDQVLRGREMHWIRVDRFNAEQGVFFQPVPCMHCEDAPCEYICPVDATVHSHDGLNDMIYNRCVGTRFCSNNCPYKVRRFNFLAYSDFATPALKPLRNPEVTVRSRGVMEKCTYCVQRIRVAVIASERAREPIPPGSLRTACQQACPSRAIEFGDMNNPRDEVNAWKAEPHNYGLLADLHTVPHTTYLAAIRNINPHMPGAQEENKVERGMQPSDR